MPKFCRNCGNSLKDEARFCGGCGTPCADDAAAQPEAQPQPQAPAPSQPAPSSPPPPPGAAPAHNPPPPPGPSFAQNPPPPPPGSGPAQPLGPNQQPGQSTNLTAQGRVWADKLGASAGSQSNLVKRIIRATCLDPETHREVANNNGLNNEAGIALAIGLAGSAIGSVIWLPYVGGFNVKLILIQLLMSACSMAAFIFAISLLSQSIAGKKSEPLVVFRLVAYCAALGVVTIIPVVGPLLTLWLLVSTTVALKEITGQDLGKAIILIIVGAVGAVVVNMVVSPVIAKTMMGTGGYFG